jgi:hypothetical protein
MIFIDFLVKYFLLLFFKLIPAEYRTKFTFFFFDRLNFIYIAKKLLTNIQNLFAKN